MTQVFPDDPSQEVPANFRRFLAYPDSLWILESGEGAVFAMEKTGSLVQNGILDKGPLTYLGAAKQGAFLFGFDQRKEDPIAILLMTHTKSRLKKVSMEELSLLIQKDPQLLPSVAKQIELWVRQFAKQMQLFEKEFHDAELEAGKILDVQATQIVRPFYSVDPLHKEDLVWMEVLEGEALLFGNAIFKIDRLNGPFPLNHVAWFSAQTSLKVHGFTTQEALKHPQFWKGFKQSQEMALKIIEIAVEKKRMEDRVRVKEKEHLDALAVDSSLKHISSALEMQAPPTLTAGDDALIRACQIIGHPLNIHFTPLKEKKTFFSTREKLFELCEHSLVRCRKVFLEENFDKHDVLPLLGFYKDGRPVAILNKNGSGYKLVDPITLETTPLNASTIEQLSRDAYTFYQTFPEEKMKGSSIYNFVMRSKKKEMLTIWLVGIFGGFLTLFPPFFNKVLFSNVISSGESTLLGQIIVGYIIIAVSMGLFLLTRALTMMRLMQLIDYKLEPAVWDRILNLTTRFFRQITVGNLISRVYYISQIQQLMSGTAIKVLLSGIFSLFYFVAMLYYSPFLALIGLLLVLINTTISSVCIIYKIAIERKILALSGLLNGIVIQIISGVSKLRISGAENRAFAYWSTPFTEYQRLTRRAQIIQNIVTTITASLPVFSSAILFTLIMTGYEESIIGNKPVNLDIGSLIAFFAAFVPFSQSLYDVTNTLISIAQVVPLWERSKVILQEKPEVFAGKTKVGKLQGDLLVDNVSFRYDPTSPLVLDKLSLFANPGEYIGIVGPSGSGKSTLVRILLGFETPESGTVSYNGQDLSNLDLREIRHQIGTVLQNGSIFSGSLYDNIVCGGGYTKKEVDEAIALSGFDEDIKNFPMGLHTVVQSGGGTFSGGQLQRLLITRALVSKPKILIFDEATSALDNKTQEFISKQLDKVEVTRIVIAHRLSTIRHADRIYVMDKGTVIQAGTFQELAKQEGLFKQFLTRQQL